VPGWTDEYKWIGYVPFDELPHLFNPSQGYVATANNRVVDDKYPYVLGTEYAFGDRAQRIVELIEAREKIDVAYVQRMQFDQVSLSGRAIARHLGQLAVDDPELAEVAALMRGWDGTISAESPAAAIHQVFVRRMIARMVGDRLGELSTRYAGQGPTPLLAEGSMFGEKSWAWLLERLGEPDSHWFDLGGGESRVDVMRLGLRETIDFLKSELGPRVDHWAWGKLHTLTYTHVLGRVRPLNRLLNRGPYQLGGDGTTLWATGTRLHDLSSDGVVGPPFRFIVDLGDLRNSWSLLAPGQSGQPGSKHYDDQIQAWFRGQYHPMLWFREDVERRSRDCLRLLPAAKG
jgi:penicillin amidase